MDNNIEHGYMCGINWQHEVGEGNARGVTIFRSVKELKEDHSCWKECGIVRVKISLDKWIEDQDLEG